MTETLPRHQIVESQRGLLKHHLIGSISTAITLHLQNQLENVVDARNSFLLASKGNAHPDKFIPEFRIKKQIENLIKEGTAANWMELKELEHLLKSGNDIDGLMQTYIQTLL
jgi:hypothetical protein